MKAGVRIHTFFTVKHCEITVFDFEKFHSKTLGKIFTRGNVRDLRIGKGTRRWEKRREKDGEWARRRAEAREREEKSEEKRRGRETLVLDLFFLIAMWSSSRYLLGVLIWSK